MTHGGELELIAHRRPLRQAVIPAWAVLACILFLANAPVELRAPVEIVFFCFVPGAALVGLFNADSLGVKLSLSIALSVAVSGLTAGILLYADLWSPTVVVAIITGISVLGGLRGVRLGPGAHHLGSLLRGAHGGDGRQTTKRTPGSLLQIARLAGRAAGSVSGGLAAVPRRASRVERIPADRMALRPRPERILESPSAASPLQGFLLNELRRRAGSPASGARWRRPARSLANLEPDELSELLSWSSLQRYVTQRAIREVKPELWFVGDIERQLRRQAANDLRGRRPPPTRGVWITGVSACTSFPVAWRVLKNEHTRDWRTRLALELIDALAETGLREAVVAADTDYGSLAGFRRGLASRGLSYLLRVDPVTAAREFAPERPSRSAAEARDVLQTLTAPAVLQNAHDEAKPVIVQGAQQLISEVPTGGKDAVFWLSNFPKETSPERLDSLVRLASRGSAEGAAPDLLQVALKMAVEEGGTELDRELALIALAGGLQTLDVSGVPDEEK